MTTEALDGPAPEDRTAAAEWIVARHPQLRRLLERVPGFLAGDGSPDVEVLADTVREYEEYLAAWAAYTSRFPPPADEARYEAWQGAGPQPSDLVHALGVMSPSEQARLRMLAAFSMERVPLCVADFATLDASGRSLLTDWTIAVRCAA